MSALVEIAKEPKGKLVRLGVIQQPLFGITLNAKFNNTQVQAPEFTFNRLLGEAENDEADDLLFELSSGNEKGEVLEVDGQITLFDERTQQKLGEFTVVMQVEREFEADNGAEINSFGKLRILRFTYKAAGQTEPIDFDVFQHIAGRG